MNVKWIKWHHKLFLWLLPTYISEGDGNLCYCKYFRGTMYVVKFTRIGDYYG